MSGARPVAPRRARVRAANGLGQPVDERAGKAVPLGDPVERRILVEAPHMAGPLDDLAVSAEPEAAGRHDDRQRAEIDAGRVLPVDRDLRLAGFAPLFEGREIHEREPDRPLDLVDVPPCQEDDRARGVDPADRLAQAECGFVGEEAESLVLLRLRGVRHRDASTGVGASG